MVNFIICEDNKEVREIHENLISKITMPYDFDYLVHSFDKYKKEFKNIINSPSDLKIYILDLELPGKSGIDIAREIRKTDWDSIIIVITSHDELELKLFKQKLLIFDFISKFDNYEESLTNAINMIIKKRSVKNILTFKQHNEVHNIKFDNILYIYHDSSIDRTIIKTLNNEYKVRESLMNVVGRLDDRFHQTHRACYINFNNVKSIDFKYSTITFIDDSSTDYLSRNYKKEIRSLV